jgi:hypothetical protein
LHARSTYVKLEMSAYEKVSALYQFRIELSKVASNVEKMQARAKWRLSRHVHQRARLLSTLLMIPTRISRSKHQTTCVRGRMKRNVCKRVYVFLTEDASRFRGTIFTARSSSSGMRLCIVLAAWSQLKRAPCMVFASQHLHRYQHTHTPLYIPDDGLSIYES